MAGTAFKDKDIVAEIDKYFTPVLIDGDSNHDFGRKYGVRGYPNTVFMDHRGKKQVVVIGAVSVKRFKQELDRAVKDVGPPKPSHAYLHLENLAKELAEHMKYKSTHEALRTIAKIEKVKIECKFLDQAKAAKKQLEKAANDALAHAKDLLAEKNDDAAKAVLKKVAWSYEGLDAAKKAKSLLDGMGK